jgi:putative membrane protein
VILLRTLHWEQRRGELLTARPLSPHGHLAAHTWSLPVMSALFLAAVVYLQSCVRVRSVFPGTALGWRPIAFLSGLLALWIAVGSSLRSLDEEMLLAHMVKHLLVMAVAAPLLLLGAPHLPLAYPFLHWTPVARVTRALTHPVFCWLAATFAVMVWHVPAVFELGVRSRWWHLVQFTCFFAGGLLFWWPVIQPWQKARWSRWSLPVYLFLATLPCDVLAAYLTFCDDVVYAPYLGGSPALNASALQDQQAAGALMWVCITFVYLVPAVVITLQILAPRGSSYAMSSFLSISSREARRRS